MFVTRKTYNELDRDYTELTKEHNELWRRNREMLWLITNAAAILKPVFGELHPLSTSDERLLFRADSCLANVSLCPADGYLAVYDPHDKVASVSVTLDAYGKLNAEAQKRVERFLGEVLLDRSRSSKLGEPRVDDDPSPS